MNIDDALEIERPPIKQGEQYTFYSTMQQEYEPAEQRLRRFTGKLVTVIGYWPKDDTEHNHDGEDIYVVRAADGTEFDAYEGELNGWFVDTGQYFWPDATYGPEHDETFLANERN